MVDGVELNVADQIEQVRELEGCDALGLQQHSEAADEIANVRHMGKHVVGGGEIGA